MEPQQPTVGLFRELWCRVQGFVLPEEVVTLKVVFDNVRNYFICTTVIVAVLAIAQRNTPSIGVGAAASTIWPWSLQIVGLLLLGGNVLQSWLIISRVTSGIGRLPKAIRPTWGKWRRRSMRLILVILVAPFIFAAYQILPALIIWAVMGDSYAKAL